jgi:hypothetical protein
MATMMRRQKIAADRLRLCAATLVLAAALSASWCGRALAVPTQEDVLKSISDNVGSKSDPTPLLWGVGALVAVAMLLSMFNKRVQRKAVPKPLNNRSKLMKQMIRQIDLRPIELRQLKTLADSQNLENPLTLLLCPSLLTKAVKEDAAHVDRKALSFLAQRFN